MFKRNVGKYTFLSIFELMGTYPRDTGETSGDRRLKKGKDCTFLVWCGTQKANVIFGCTLFRTFHHGIEGDSTTLNDIRIRETYSRMHLDWFVWLPKISRQIGKNPKKSFTID